MGNLVADVIRARTGAQISFMNSGGLRKDVPPGFITQGDVIEALPFGNTISTFQIRGGDIVSALDHGVYFFFKILKNHKQ